MKAASVLAVFFDINKRLITRRKLAADTYAAGEALENAGLIVAPITGRPAGWVDQIARLRPVEGVAGETGGFFRSRKTLQPSGEGRHPECLPRSNANFPPT